MNISVIIPLFNEQNSLEELTKKIARIIDGMKLQYEILLIDDGSTDNSWNKISKICGINPNVRGIRFLKILENHKHYLLDLKCVRVM